MRLIEAFEIVTNSIEDDIKYCKEITDMII